MENEKINQIKAVMLGHAVGDALGVPVEFQSRERLEKDPVVDMRGFGTYPVPAGSWSDDTSMSLAALDSLASGQIDYNEIMDNFVKWCFDNEYTPTGEMFDIGRTCMDAIRNYALCQEGGKNALLCGCDDEFSNGNGSLMRIHPFVLMAFFKEDLHKDWKQIIENGSSLTHRHPCSTLACRLYAEILRHLLLCPNRGILLDAYKFVRGNCRHETEFERYHNLFSLNFPATPIEKIKSSGYVVDTLEAAVWCLLTTNSYRECVLKAVNLGEDTDTVAAIAGGLAGALYGLDAIPKEWLAQLKKREYIEEMCERAAENW